MLSWLAVYARNIHIIVQTANFEFVRLNSAGENAPFLNLAVPPLFTKFISNFWAFIFYTTLNMARSAEHAACPFLASRFAREHNLEDRPHTSLWFARHMLFLLACVVVKYGVGKLGCTPRL